MELRAVLELLRATDPAEPLTIQSDSAYVVGVFTEWLPVWRSRGMRTGARKAVSNVDLIEKITGYLSGRDVTFEKVPGHAGHPLNEQADALAQSAARRTAAVVVSGRPRLRP
jgi:ribonuclease HI